MGHDPGMRSDLFAPPSHDPGARFARYNAHTLRVLLGPDVLARQGSMVAYRGDVDFDYEGSGSLGRFLKKALTGEGVPLMRCAGQGEVFFAEAAARVSVLALEGESLSINSRHLLAFDAALQWDIQRVEGAGVMGGQGLFNLTVTGHGSVALTTDGYPILLAAGPSPTYVDTDALVGWSVGLRTSMHRTVKAKALIGRGSGEALQMAFVGEGFVVVQPSEGRPVAPTA